jgi:hypothetical protein
LRVAFVVTTRTPTVATAEKLLAHVAVVDAG